MTVQLDSLLEYNRARSGPGLAIGRAFGDLEVAVTEELKLRRSALLGAKTELVVQGGTRFLFDRSRMCEALGNLAENAVKRGLSAELLDVAQAAQCKVHCTRISVSCSKTSVSFIRTMRTSRI